MIPAFLAVVGIAAGFFAMKRSGPNISGNNNRQAFLAMLRMSEGTAPYAYPYQIYFGGVQFNDTSDHPVNTGELSPVETKWGSTTAAGAYQFEVGTWNALGGIAHYGDFSAGAQDAAALDLIASCNALEDIDNGAIHSAIAKLGTQWASLPSSTAGQPTTALSSILGTYTSNGGIITDVA